MSAALAVPQNIALLALPADEVAELNDTIRENLGGDLQARDLPTIKNPQGSTAFFEVTTVAGSETPKFFDAVILARQKHRVYYPNPNSTSNEPPTCHSVGGDYGEGDPGGACAQCPLSQFTGSERPPCKERIETLLATTFSPLPFRFSLAPASLRNFRSYMTTLTGGNLRYSEVITRIGLKPSKAANGGQDYSQVTFEYVRKLEGEEKARIQALVSSMGS